MIDKRWTSSFIQGAYDKDIRLASDAAQNQNYQQALDYINGYIESEDCTKFEQKTIALAAKSFYLSSNGQTVEAFELANSIEFPHAWSMTFIYICFKAGKYQEALEMI